MPAASRPLALFPGLGGGVGGGGAAGGGVPVYGLGPGCEYKYAAGRQAGRQPLPDPGLLSSRCHLLECGLFSHGAELDLELELVRSELTSEPIPQGCQSQADSAPL